MTQKNCIDFILQETTSKSKTNLNELKKAVSDDSKVMKSENKSLKSDLPTLMTKSEENCFAKVKMEIEALQSAMDTGQCKR